MHRAPSVAVPVLRNLHGGRLMGADGLRQVAGECVPAEIRDRADFAVTKPVGVILVDKETGIIDQELRNPVLPIGEHWPDTDSIGEIEAVVAVGSGLTVVEPKATCVERAVIIVT